MLNPLIIGLSTFAVIQAGAVTGWAIRQRLPKHHLTDETKGLVSVSWQWLLRFRRWCLDC